MIRRAIPSIARFVRPLRQARSFAVASPRTADLDEEEARRQAVRLALDKKTGRGWTDPWDLDELMDSRMEYDDLPDWSPDLVSRTSQERLQVQSIPSLTALTQMNLPSPPPPSPGQGYTKVYALQRQRKQHEIIREQVEASALSRLPAIQALPSWEEKQDAVDELFEEIEFQLKASNPVLGMHPRFGEWVEKALEEYLQSIQKAGLNATSTSEENKDKPQEGIPVFMDCYSDKDGPEQLVPSILHPLAINPRGTNGNMVEEWELAAHKTSKRIMIRTSTQRIASALTEHTATSILVSGCQGVGKTAAVAAIVASARSSGYLVLYLPNGDQLHQNGFYVEPNPQKKGIFDIPIMSQRACDDFLKTHKSDMIGLNVPKGVIAEHLAKDQLQRLFRDAKDDSQIALNALLDFGRGRINFAAPCLSAAMDYLMYHQDEKPFLLAMDEFNCFYMPSHYFHADYDPEVKKAIPYNCINLFRPAMEATALTGSSSPRTVKRGAVLVAVTESHAVTRATTDALVNRAKELSAEEGTPFVHVEVPRLSKLEVEHMLSNYEATGVGKLRLDRGETVSNAQEVEYLRMVSGGIAGHLMNACMVE
ncbi:hypothetical protein FisN_10Hh241 [Fistulifera solaris]|uniref:Small ribosomal subunit protein mS29 n=1 Tax=Fistulifera solaris TaxID=1519565 RepID=A0A1Z5JXK7_FISSO|nr:hypothetical protein FisN_10Hh241 [Fistulifera solaris]|eukprot:GAX18558.1 hypothetical protein FisN_10Hh241 [Fistulifera solaris]